ncbi:DUF342 domain-containing protein [Lachnobacterium bovis]|uniref:DUF342 domain-containing protein n=1 Tax=Lachnobacterium bovis TaxID=140626 RepID=UPI00048E9725|nr:FapA family protein [Lachnobacterium bovis]
MKNQKFEIVVQEKIAYLKVLPPDEDGQRVDVQQVLYFLGKKEFNDYNLKELTSAINDATEEKLIKVGASEQEKFDESVDCDIAFDKMSAKCIFYPGSKTGKKISKEMIMAALSSSKVSYGIMDDAIDKAIKNIVYFKEIVLARGKEVEDGKDGKVKYYFNTNPSHRPRQKADGSVDYKNLDTISQAKKGDVVAEIIKEVEGTPGVNVLGEEKAPKAPNPATITAGNGVSFNEEGDKLVADFTGHISLDKGAVVMSEVYEVASDVDNSTGNLSYAGSVTIKGNVTSGFSVTANGNIEIEGMVEDAYIEATGQVIIKGGIVGKGKGVIKAGENVIVKYIESAKVIAKGYIETDIILNSDVSAGIDVRVSGKKGIINGGIVRASRYVEANGIGTSMGSPTTIMVGLDPKVREELSMLTQNLAEKEEELEKIKVTVTNFSSRIKKGENFSKDKILYVQKLALVYKEQQKALSPMRERLEEIKAEMKEADKSYVVVSGDVQPGTIIIISDLRYTVKSSTAHSKFVKRDGEVRIAGMD